MARTKAAWAYRLQITVLLPSLPRALLLPSLPRALVLRGLLHQAQWIRQLAHLPILQRLQRKALSLQANSQQEVQLLQEVVEEEGVPQPPLQQLLARQALARQAEVEEA